MDDTPATFPTKELSLKDLHLDPWNPRLPTDEQTTDEQRLLEYIANTYNAIEIATSMATFGYFPSEPLIAVRREDDDAYDEDDGYVVLEGNRRLVALKLLENPALAQDLDDADEWQEVAQLARESALLPSRFPVVTAGSRGDVAPIIGYRHISGIIKWEPYAKARFVAGQVERSGLSLDEVAERVGERYTETASLYRNYKIVEQAREEFGIDTSSVVGQFGVFTRALSSRPLRNYIGVPSPSDVEVERLPVPEDKAENVQELFSWLFGVKERGEPAVIDESRDISRLGTAVDSEQGVEALRSTRNLEVAFEAAGGLLGRLRNYLSRAQTNLADAQDLMPGHEDDKDVARLLSECQEALEELKSRHAKG